ncbi:hypothetical protein SNE35_24850 [Paucibacter sp. R3-3]|uniref:Uncharacterized protein n=1 Tax=Roseateles agri TaxID=3098619 RepID=A0ABU5DN73_9BURK|nr:hypothetical protein [Paucibacter sp. R3-3]MDY0747756.1 hypothetical protein [Paucibacter sp. R3-3]
MSRNATIRAEFQRFVGDKEYRRFLVVGVSSRLRFWQERLVSAFVQSAAGLSATPEEVVIALRVCEVHGDELIEGSVPGVAAEIDYAPSDEARTKFPKADSDPVGLGSGAGERAVPVWYCPSCRRLREAWLQRANYSIQRTAYGDR